MTTNERSGYLSPAEEGENAAKRDNDRAEAEALESLRVKTLESLSDADSRIIEANENASDAPMVTQFWAKNVDDQGHSGLGAVTVNLYERDYYGFPADDHGCRFYIIVTIGTGTGCLRAGMVDVDRDGFITFSDHPGFGPLADLFSLEAEEGGPDGATFQMAGDSSSDYTTRTPIDACFVEVQDWIEANEA